MVNSLTGARPAPHTPLHGAVLVSLLIGSTLLASGLMLHDRIGINDRDSAFFAMSGTMLALGALRYRLRGARLRVTAATRDLCEDCLTFMAICLLGVVLSYPIAASTLGFSDTVLQRTDSLLHFNWADWYAFVIRHPVLRIGGAVAYSTIFVTPAILLGHMAWHGQRGAARQFLVTFWLAAMLTLMLFPLFPAKGPLATLWTGPIPYMPTSALYQSQIIPALRNHLFQEIDMGALRGLVCAPSFHTVCGSLYIATAWPIARLRWPVVTINAAMLLATPVEGNHYLSDMLLGLAVAIVAIVVVRGLLRMAGTQRVGTSVSARRLTA
jgi:hypothetical protein